ncbi:hypothetical protein NKI87_06700 [Mesorhizobium sp. M0322]
MAFGKLFLANPNLVRRLWEGAELNTPDKSTFYGGGAKTYIDYPVGVNTTISARRAGRLRLLLDGFSSWLKFDRSRVD